MLRVVIALLIAAHGLLHLIGFAYGFRLFYTSAYTGQTTIPLPLSAVRLTNAAWLLSCLLFLAAALLFLNKKDGWWMTGTGAVVLSQTLIVLNWTDAKWGTIVNGLLALLLIVACGSWQFNRLVQRDVQSLLRQTSATPAVVTEAQLAPLPFPVQQWLRRSGVVGSGRASVVRLHQRGRMRTKEDGKWMPLNAVQYIRTGEPGFVWVAEVKAAPGIYLSGRDLYRDGRGHMLIKLLSLYPVAENKGPQIDQAALLRYLAEIVWCPSAALEPYIRWQPVDGRRALATISCGGVSASGEFGFTTDGAVASFEAARYYARKGGATLETWSVTIDTGSYKAFNGIRIPMRSSITWKLREGDFTWYVLEAVEPIGNKP